MNCPRCNEKSIPDGKFIVAKNVVFDGEIKIIFKFRVTIMCDLFYCPNCGYNAVQNIKFVNQKKEK